MTKKIQKKWLFLGGLALSLILAVAIIIGINSFAGITLSLSIESTTNLPSMVDKTRIGSVSGGTASTSSDYIKCGNGYSACSTNLTKPITLTASPSQFYAFDYFLVNSQKITNSTITVSNLQNASVKAFFKPVSLTVNNNSNPTEGGSVSPSKVTGGYFTDHVITALPTSGFELINWYPCNIISGNDGIKAKPVSKSVTIRIAAQNQTCTANFARTATVNNQVVVNGISSPTTGGTVTKNPSATWTNLGTNIVLTATAKPGYTFSKWSGCTDLESATINVIADANKSCVANFTANPVTPTTPQQIGPNCKPICPNSNLTCAGFFAAPPDGCGGHCHIEGTKNCNTSATSTQSTSSLDTKRVVAYGQDELVQFDPSDGLGVEVDQTSSSEVGKTNMSGAGGGIMVSKDNFVKIELPKDVSEDDLTIVIEKVREPNITLPIGYTLFGNVYKLTAFNSKGEEVTNFKKQVKVNIRSEKLFGNFFKDNTLSLWTSGGKGSLTKLQTAYSDKDESYYTLTDHFSYYFVAGQTDRSMVVIIISASVLLVVFAILIVLKTIRKKDRDFDNRIDNPSNSTENSI